MILEIVILTYLILHSLRRLIVAADIPRLICGSQQLGRQKHAAAT